MENIIIFILYYKIMQPPTTVNPMNRMDSANNLNPLFTPQDYNTRCNNITKWIYLLSCGTFSLCTCGAFCGGCCGFICGPNILDSKTSGMDKNISNAVKWIEAYVIGITYLPTLGYCCGYCGKYSPNDLIKTNNKTIINNV